MVKRYPHIATVVIESKGSFDRGKYVKGETDEISALGRYESVDSSREVVKKNANGDEKIVHAEFYTQKCKVEGAVRLKIPELGVDVDIICWDNYQSYSLISV